MHSATSPAEDVILGMPEDAWSQLAPTSGARCGPTLLIAHPPSWCSPRHCIRVSRRPVHPLCKARQGLSPACSAKPGQRRHLLKLRTSQRSLKAEIRKFIVLPARQPETGLVSVLKRVARRHSQWASTTPYFTCLAPSVFSAGTTFSRSSRLSTATPTVFMTPVAWRFSPAEVYKPSSSRKENISRAPGAMVKISVNDVSRDVSE